MRYGKHLTRRPRHGRLCPTPPPAPTSSSSFRSGGTPGGGKRGQEPFPAVVGPQTLWFHSVSLPACPAGWTGKGCRVAPDRCRSGALSEPDKEVSTIRLFRCCVSQNVPVPLPSGVAVTWPTTSTGRPCFSPEDHNSTSRLRSAGSRCHTVPRLQRYYAALRLPGPVVGGSDSSRRRLPPARTFVLRRLRARP
jgi:hypothetical protein